MKKPAFKTVALSLVGALLFFGFIALGTWQVYRLQWKLDLIHRVDTRIHAPVQPAPAADKWAEVTRKADEYLHVSVEGVFLHDKSVKVQALSDLGSGFWLITPLKMDNGNIVLINRGFVPPESKKAYIFQPLGKIKVTGLLRITEPKGGFLRDNNPAQNRWYSRDVAAIAKAQGLTHVAPYFIDEDSEYNKADAYPVGGLTVVHFHNSHLVYAITWYTLALMVLWAAWRFRRNA